MRNVRGGIHAPGMALVVFQITVAHVASAAQQPLGDAWWTGPILTSGAAVLPPGHVLVEPYLYDVIGSRSNSYGSRTYLISGVAKRLAIGLIPTFGFNTVRHGPSSSHVGAGDVTLLGAV